MLPPDLLREEGIPTDPFEPTAERTFLRLKRRHDGILIDRMFLRIYEWVVRAMRTIAVAFGLQDPCFF